MWCNCRSNWWCVALPAAKAVKGPRPKSQGCKPIDFRSKDCHLPEWRAGGLHCGFSDVHRDDEAQCLLQTCWHCRMLSDHSQALNEQWNVFGLEITGGFHLFWTNSRVRTQFVHGKGNGRWNDAKSKRGDHAKSVESHFNLNSVENNDGIFRWDGESQCLCGDQTKVMPTFLYSKSFFQNKQKCKILHKFFFV